MVMANVTFTHEEYILRTYMCVQGDQCEVLFSSAVCNVFPEIWLRRSVALKLITLYVPVRTNAML